MPLATEHAFWQFAGVKAEPTKDDDRDWARSQASPRAQQTVGSASSLEKQLEHAQHLSAMTEKETQQRLADEETRMLNEALQASTLESQQAEHERMKRVAEEQAQLELALDHSRRDKGKAVETDEQRREREELEMAMALSLEESRRRPSAVTSAEMFELLSRPSEQERQDHTREKQALDAGLLGQPLVNLSNGDISLEHSSSRSSSSQQTNSNSLGLPVPPQYNYPEDAPENDEPDDIVIGPGRPVPTFLPSQSPTPPSRRLSFEAAESFAPVGSPANLSASSSQSSLVQRFDHDPTRASFMSTASVAGSFESEAYIDTAQQLANAQSLQFEHSLPIQRSDHGEYPLEARTDESFDDAHDVTDLFGRTSVRRADNRLRGPRQPYARAPEPRQETFDDNHQALTLHERRENGHAPPVVTKSLPSIALTSVSSSSDDTASTTTRLSPTGTTPVEQPSFGGFIETASDNVLADERVLSGVRWAFVEPTKAMTHMPLEHEGDFPRAAQLSREKHDDERVPFGAFAVEASTWQSLLVYLMWHGHSRFEAAPSDLQGEKSGRGLAVDITVDFYRSSQDETPRVRCQLELLPPGITEKRPEDGGSSLKRQNTFDSDCPSISIRITDPIGPYLPVPLSKVAQMLSQAHTQSRAALKQSSSWRSATVASAASTSSSSSSNGQPSAAATLSQQRELALAIDLFNKLSAQLDSGINYDSRAASSSSFMASQTSDGNVDDNDREMSLMRNLRARLKNKIRKGRATGSHALSHVKGSSSSSLSTEYHQQQSSSGTSSDGRGKGRRKVVELNLVQSSVDRRNDLPEGARLITPFRLDDVAE
ncbi:hypothetical protein ACM66B_002528 [Microbotryomycetes sp. NB124-2]